jgi:hypothetical protein
LFVTFPPETALVVVIPDILTVVTVGKDLGLGQDCIIIINPTERNIKPVLFRKCFNGSKFYIKIS